RLAAHGELHLVALRSQRRDDGVTSGNRHPIRYGVARHNDSGWFADRDRQRRWLAWGHSLNRQFADHRHGVWSRMKRCDLLLHFALTLVPGRLQDALVILSRQMSREQTHRGEVERSVCELFEDDGEFLRSPRRLDAAICRMFRQSEALRAVRKERRVAFTQIEPARVELRKRRDQP